MNKNDTLLIDLNIISSSIFICAAIISLGLIINERNKTLNKDTKIDTKTALNIAFYNRIVILISVLISAYVGYKNYKNEENNTIGKYKSSLLFSTNIIIVISSIIVLYVSYLNKQEQSLSVSDVENPLI